MKKFFIWILIVLPGLQISASNLKIRNVAVSGMDNQNQVAALELDVSWQDSWRNQTNHDAVWLFIKYKGTYDREWKHAYIAPADSLHQWPSSAEVAKQAEGLFLSMKQNGQGANHFTKLRIGIQVEGYFADTGQIDVRVFGVEMVYIPEGAFYLGDGASHGSFEQPGSNASVRVSNEKTRLKCRNTILDDPSIENEGLDISGQQGLSYNADSMNQNFPTGYAGFYVMKYELGQEAYTHFLNMLGQAQAENRYPGHYGQNRQGILYDKKKNSYTCTQPYLPCNYLSWADACAWADWAGLRPITETEYEKAARGSGKPTAHDLPWGAKKPMPAVEISNPGTGTETPSDINANCAANPAGIDSRPPLDGPMRSGCFANNMWQRSSSGVSSYGVFELSGNLQERCVSIGNQTGRSFTGTNGDGQLSPSGNADQTNWPGMYQGQVTEADGSGTRGGSWMSGIPQLSTSNRLYASMPNTYRAKDIGFRAGRTMDNEQ